MNRLLVALAATLMVSACSPRETVVDGFGNSAQKLRVVNRTATGIPDRNGMRLSDASGNGVAWVEGSDFRTGTIEVDIRGQESLGRTLLASPSIVRATTATRPSI